MDKPIEEWERRLRGMGPSKLEHAWLAKADDELSWLYESNFHVAAAERMKRLGNMAIDLDDDTRKSLCRQAEKILERLQAYLKDKPERLEEIEAVTRKSSEYFQKYGTRTARYYMFEQGVIDELGDVKLRA